MFPEASGLVIVDGSYPRCAFRWNGHEVAIRLNAEDVLYAKVAELDRQVTGTLREIRTKLTDRLIAHEKSKAKAARAAIRKLTPNNKEAAKTIIACGLTFKRENSPFDGHAYVYITPNFKIQLRQERSEWECYVYLYEVTSTRQASASRDLAVAKALTCAKEFLDNHLKRIEQIRESVTDLIDGCSGEEQQ